MQRPSRADGVIITLMALIAMLAVIPTGFEISAAAIDPAAWGDMPFSGTRIAFLARSVWVSAVIAGAACIFAGPLAQLLRRTGPGAAALLIAPVWMPAWLMYAGLNLARAPDTILGGAIIEWALPDHRWALVALGRTLAIASMVLWSVPIAALVMAAVGDPDADAADELLRTEPLGWLHRISTRFRLRRSAWLAAFGAVVLLTLGSSIPLHLAQVDTDTIVMWRALADRSPDRWGGIWLGSYPQLIIALIGSVWFITKLGTKSRPGENTQPIFVSPLALSTRLGAWFIWSLAAVLPLALMASSLDSWSSLSHWIGLNRRAFAASGTIAGIGAAVIGVASVAIAASASSERVWSRRCARIIAAASLLSFLLPGVLVGAGFARFGARLNIDPAVLGVAASIARTLFVAGIAGLILANAESPEHRAMRQLDDRGDALGWITTNPARALRLFCGAGLGAFLLGLHEIEASVIIRPPGMANLPQQMLADLHYARLEQLSAGGVVIGLLAIGLGSMIGLILKTRSEQPGSDRPVPPTV